MNNQRKGLATSGAALSFALGIALLVLLGNSDRALPGYFSGLRASYLLIGLQELLMFGLPVVLLFWRSTQSWDRLKALVHPLGVYDHGLAALGGVAFSLSGALITVFWLMILAQFGVAPLMLDLPRPQNALDYAAAFVGAAIIPAVCEELMFRGLLIQALPKRLSPLWAVIASAAVFSLLHFYIQGAAVLMVFGVLLGAIAVRRQTILPGMIFHAAYNAAAILLNAKQTQPTLLALGICVAVSAAVLPRLMRREAEDGTDHLRV